MQEYQVKKIKVLAVDDNNLMRDSYQEILELNGYIVDTAMNGVIALEKFELDKPDIVIIDYHMPGMNGMELTDKIKNLDENIPVLIVTCDITDDADMAFSKSRANDFITAEMGFPRILARMAKLIREKYLKPEYDFMIWGFLSIDYDKKKVFISGKEINLTALEFKLLEFFTKNYGCILDKDTILKNLRQISYSCNEDSLRVIISRLKKKINNNNYEFIHNKYENGYYFEKKLKN
jgi:DNA-binding response OmpR family regulator